MRPVELTGIVNRTPDYAQLKQNEDQKPVMEQTAFQTQFNKQVERNSDTVVKKHDSEWKNEKFDAKEKGKNKYFGSSGKKKENKGEDDKSEPGRHTSFDVRI
jgi:hypothetical protein